MNHKRPRVASLLIILLLLGCQKTTQSAATTPPAQTRAPLPGMEAEGNVPQSKDDVPRITPQELRDMLTSARRVVVIDVRGHDAYAAAHIPGALDIPYADIEAQAQQLPRNTPIVLYCA